MTNGCLALALLALMVQSEAPYESPEGKLAVAYVAVNRAVLTGAPLQAVLQQRNQFALNGHARVTEASWLAAQQAFYRLHPDPTHGADHFYNPAVKPWPPWYDERHMTARIGRHIFLKLGGY